MALIREAYENSKEEDMERCFCFKYASDVALKPLDPNNIYQQFEIHPSEMDVMEGRFCCQIYNIRWDPSKVSQIKWLYSANLNS